MHAVLPTVTTGILLAAGLVDCSSSGGGANDATDAGPSASVDAGVATDAETDAPPDAPPDAAPPSYSPCPPAGTACVIMPLGDSITYGVGSSTGGGYRLRLLHDIWAANLDATFVGDNASGPNALDGKGFPKNNEGYSGYTIAPAPAVSRAGISSLVPAALAKYSPHIVTF